MRVLGLIILLSISHLGRADAWDDLTESQAHAVVRFLQHNPFIIDYCDCCGPNEPAYLIKVESSEIVECSWDKKKFSVTVKGRRITRFQLTEKGIDDYHTDPADREVEYTIYMNYTFGFDHHMKWAVPLHKLINYDKEGPICFGATNYPNPVSHEIKITDDDYFTWYEKHISK